MMRMPLKLVKTTSQNPSDFTREWPGPKTSISDVIGDKTRQCLEQIDIIRDSYDQWGEMAAPQTIRIFVGNNKNGHN